MRFGLPSAVVAAAMLTLTGCGGNPSPAVGSSPSTIITSSSSMSSATNSYEPTDGDTVGTQDPSPSSEPETTTATDEQTASDQPVVGTDPITVKNFGIGPVADGDFTSWGVVLSNPGVDIASVDVTVTGLNKSGTAIATGSASLFRVPNGESYVGGLFTEKGVIKIEVDVSGDTPYKENNAPVTGDLTGKLTITGRSFDAIVSAKVTSTLDVATKDGMPYYIVYFNSAGKVVGGANGFTPGSFQPGKTRQVSLQNSMSGPPADQFSSAKISFDVSESYMKAS